MSPEKIAKGREWVSSSKTLIVKITLFFIIRKNNKKRDIIPFQYFITFIEAFPGISIGIKS